MGLTIGACSGALGPIRGVWFLSTLPYSVAQATLAALRQAAQSSAEDAGKEASGDVAMVWSYGFPLGSWVVICSATCIACKVMARTTAQRKTFCLDASLGFMLEVQHKSCQAEHEAKHIGAEIVLKTV